MVCLRNTCMDTLNKGDNDDDDDDDNDNNNNNNNNNNLFDCTTVQRGSLPPSRTSAYSRSGIYLCPSRFVSLLCLLPPSITYSTCSFSHFILSSLSQVSRQTDSRILISDFYVCQPIVLIAVRITVIHSIIQIRSFHALLGNNQKTRIFFQFSNLFLEVCFRISFIYLEGHYRKTDTSDSLDTTRCFKFL
jgi:hypothetical protein